MQRPDGSQNDPRTDQQTHSDGSGGILQPGTRAPEFTLHDAPDTTMSLSDMRGRAAVLVFYPADWSPVCGDQLALYNQVMPMFEEHGARIAGISVDGVWCHRAYTESRNLHFPLLSDFEPKGEVSRAFGAYREQDGTSERALFVLDKDGIVTWSYLSPVNVNPGADGIISALEDLSARKKTSAGTEVRR